MLKKKTSAYLSLFILFVLANPIHAQCPVVLNQIVYSQSSVYGTNTAATNSLMTNGIFSEPLSTGTNNGNEWIKMDLGSVTAVTSVIIGCDYNNTLAGGWGKSYTENKNVEYSSDNVNWTNSFNTGIFNQGIKTFTVNFSARYIRITSSGWLAATEFYANSVASPTIIASSNSICAGNPSTLTIMSPAGASNALNFDGANDFVAIPSVSQLMLLSGWTLETWVKRASSGAQHSLIEKYDWAGGTGGYLLRITASGQANAANIAGTSGDNVFGTTVLAPGTWYHVAATFNPGTSSLKIYVNGVLEGTNNAAGLPPANSSVTLKLGARGNDSGSPLNGAMDEVRVWNVERTQAQIAASRSITIPGNSSGLVAYYQFNESSGLTTADMTGNFNAGTLTNGPTWQVPSTAPVTSTGLATGTFSWSNGATTASIVVSPTVTTAYTVINTNTAACSVTATPITVSVTPLPVLSVSGFTAICVGQTATLVATGANTFTWSNASTSASITLSPTSNTSYSLTGTAAGCEGSTTQTLLVNPIPTITVNSGTICAGQNFSINPNGANTYTIQGGNAVVSPPSNASYTVIGTSTEGCVSQAFTTSSLTVNANPSITVNSGAICVGQSFTINPAGANTFTIQGGNAVVSPSLNTTYTVAGTSTAGCVSQAFTTSSLTVNANPTITVNSGAICAGQSFTINPVGANAYTIQGANAVVSPSINTTFTVAGTSAAGCVSQAFATSSLTVNANPSITVNSGAICAGQSFTINPAGANTYTIQGANAVVSPSINTTYTVVGTSTAGCVSQAFTTSSLIVNPNPSITVNSGAICAGQSFTINPAGANTYTIQGGNAIVNPSINTTYTVAGTNTLTGCRSQASATSSLSVNPNPSITVNSGAICAGQNFTINPAGANTYTIQGGNAVVSPAINTTYTVAGTSAAGCVSQAFTTSSLTVNANPSITVNSGAICAGQNFTINPNGANTYTIQGGNAIVSPSINTTYTVAGTSTAGCVSQAFITSSLLVNPNPIITVNNGTICAGQTFTINPNGANTYTIQGANAVVSPSINTTYTVAGTSTAGCVSQAFTTSSLVVNPNPTITVNSGAICAGQTFTINPNGANTYTLQSGNAVVSPSINTTYTVIGTNTLTGCRSQSFATSNLTVNPNPTVSITGASGICTGQNASLTANGASSYTWNTGSTSTSIVTTPTANTTYTLTGSTPQGCSSFTTQLVSVQLSLSVSIAGPTSVCYGQAANLSGLGGVTYTWNTGATTATVAPTLTTTTTFSVIGASGTCSNTAIRTISVTPNPTVSITGTTAICSGSSASLTVNGATTYTWSTLSTNTSVVVSPSATTVYSVVGSFSTGCAQLAAQTVSVYALPVVSISGPSVVCVGGSITLNANGAATYVWDNTATTASIVVSPTASASYSAVGTDTNGCNASASSSVTANPVPVMSVVKTTSAVCQGDSLSFTATGADTYSWSNGALTNSIVVTPTSSATYSVVGTNTFGCTSLLTDSVKVNAVPVLTITGNTGTICIGETIVLDLTGAATYSWSTGASTSSISVSPSIASTYSATGTSTDACVSAITASVQVSECTNLKTIASKAAIKVYPNPNNGEFVIELTTSNESSITITTVLGQIILTQKAGLINKMNLNGCDKGIYFITVMENNQSLYRGSIIKE